MTKRSILFMLLLLVLSSSVLKSAVPQEKADSIKTEKQHTAQQAKTQTTATAQDGITLKEAIPWILTVLALILGVLGGVWAEKWRRRRALQAEDEHADEKNRQAGKSAEQRYQDALQREVCQMQMTGAGLEGVAVNLADTFVRLNISHDYRSEDFPLLGEGDRAQVRDDNLSPEAVLKQAFQEDNKKLLLIIGDPGSGKSTLMNYYAMRCLEKNSWPQLDFEKQIFPLLLPLRNLDTKENLSVNLATWGNKRQLGIDAKQFHNWLHEKQILLLLDGLDEVNDLTKRKDVCRWIDETCTGLTKANVVVTSRSTGFRNSDNIAINTPLLRAEIRDFTRMQKEEFLQKWFCAAFLKTTPAKDQRDPDWQQRQKAAAQKSAAEVITYLDANRSLGELAGIPMLLQLIALIWNKHKVRPESRSDLYDIALDYLLEYRDDQRGPDLAPLLKAKKARLVLEPTALWLQEKFAKDSATKDKMHEYMQPILDDIDHTIKAKRFCMNIRDRAGVIADYGKDEYIFRHKSFKEYFAGMQLVKDYDSDQRLQKLVDSFGKNEWLELLRYFMSRADGKAFTAFMQVFFNSVKSQELSQEEQDLLQILVEEAPEKKLDAFISCLKNKNSNANQKRYALECLKTIGGPRVQEILTAFVHDSTPGDVITQKAEETAAQIAAPDTQSTTTHPGILTDELPPSFRNPFEYNAEYILTPAGTVQNSVTNKIEKIPNLYFAKYPVTNKQYRRFIRYLKGEENDLNERFSSEQFAVHLLGFAKDITKFKTYLGHERQQWAKKMLSEYEDNRKFNGDEQPVVGISWYAARAYCLWLSFLEARNQQADKELRTAELARIYRLPDEWQWQRAAGGRLENGEPRKYPWPQDKGELNEKLANFNRNIGYTSAVGRYPEGATPEGLMDMAGNVWEWQENWHDEKKERRALRGGSWLNITNFMPCAIRGGNVPHFRFDNVGFRVLRSESFS